MGEAMYTPPEADLVAGAAEEGNRHYVVGIRKFLVLSIATLNAYNTYWFWRNFRDLRDASGKDLWPIPRALFAVFFTHGLFRDVDETLRGQGRSFAWSPDATASAVVVLLVLSNISSNVSARVEGAVEVVEIVSLALSMLVPFAMLPAQRAINAANGDPEGRSNDHLTAANWIWILLGGVLWALTLVGFLMVFAGVDVEA